MPRLLNKQVIIRVNDDFKVFADAIMKARGETQQEVMEAAHRRYVFENVDCTNESDLLPAVVEYVNKCHEADIAPLNEKMEAYRAIKAQEDARQQENIQLYEKVKATENGKNLLDLIARRLRSEDQNHAFTRFYEEYHSAIKDLVDTDDDNEALKAMKILATIHTNT